MNDLEGAEEIEKKNFGGPSPRKKTSKEGPPPGKKKFERPAPGNSCRKAFPRKKNFGQAIARKK